MFYIVEGALSFVTEQGLRRIMSKANLNFLLFSHSTAKYKLLSMYMGERDKVKNMLLKAL